MANFKPEKKTNGIEMMVITIRVEPNTINMLDKLANIQDMSRNAIINQCINFSLNNLDNDLKEQLDKLEKQNI